jgi:hypothetical protein
VAAHILLDIFIFISHPASAMFDPQKCYVKRFPIEIPNIDGFFKPTPYKSFFEVIM